MNVPLLGVVSKEMDFLNASSDAGQGRCGPNLGNVKARMWIGF